MQWTIYYDTEQTFTDADGPWSAAPAEGVLAVVERRGDRTEIHSGADFYRLEQDGTIIATEDAATILRAVGVVPMSPIKFGRYTSNTKMRDVFERIRLEWGGG